MPFFHVATIFVVLSLVGVEASIFVFIDPAAWRLAPGPQLQFLSSLASVLGRVMPVWYPVCAVLFGTQTWVSWHTAGRGLLLTADAIWLLACLGSILFLVPLNTRVAEGAADWQQAHRLWDRRHRVRTAALATAALLLTYVVVR